MTIQVRCTRAMMYAGRRVEPGEVLALDPLGAGAAIDSGRAEFVDPTAAAIVRAAVQKDAARVVRENTPAPQPARFGVFGRAV